MKWRFLLFLGGILIVLGLFMKDREITAGVERLTGMSAISHEALDADPDLKRISEGSPYMRNER